MSARSAAVFFVSQSCHPQTIEVVQTRARPLGIEVVVGDHRIFQVRRKVFRRVGPIPGHRRRRFSITRTFAHQVHAAGALLVVAADLLALTLLRPPGEFGADVAVGSAQRFGVPLGYGGPHAAFFATTEACKRLIPGRLVGVSKDSAWPPGVAPGPANARATHPPRKGHQQHLHGAGAAGQHRLHVRRLSRPGRPEKHRPPRSIA